MTKSKYVNFCYLSHLIHWQFVSAIEVSLCLCILIDLIKDMKCLIDHKVC